MSGREEKFCAVCGRRVEWRRKWADCWEEVRHCSAGCRKRGLRAADRALETAIGGLLERRAAGATICPSEAARAVFPEEAWRDRMEDARMAARRMAARGELVITQEGRAVDASTAKGPIRLGRPAARA